MIKNQGFFFIQTVFPYSAQTTKGDAHIKKIKAIRLKNFLNKNEN